MSIGPLFMGFLLQRLSPKRMLAWCLGLLGMLTLVFPLIGAFGFLKLIRFFIGGVIAAQLAATMTYIAFGSDNMRQVMGYYVGAAVLGGLSGRIIAGFVSEYLHWSYFFFGLAIFLFVVFDLALKLSDVAYKKRKGFSVKAIWQVLSDVYIRRMYLTIMAAFFVMTGVLNFVPFRLEILDATLGESLIALFYLGFIVGFFVSIKAPQIADLVGGTDRAAWVGIGMVITGIIVATIASVYTVFVALTLVTSGFFLLHTSVATLLNRYAADQAGNVNSLYISIYYLGGSAGSYLPGLLFVAHGWMSFLSLLGISIAISIFFFIRAAPHGNAFLKVS